MTHSVRIAPSILAADFSRLGEEVRAIDQAGADMIHIDVMDGHFVPNLTIGPSVVKALRPHTSKPFDVHLMVQNPDALIPAFAKAGADSLTIHAEATNNVCQTLQLIKSLNKKAGLALRPNSSIEILTPFLSEIDLILVMTVDPGFGGQTFMLSQLDKINTIRALIDKEFQKSGRTIDLEVDGGLNPETAPMAITAGANVLVAGTAVFRNGSSAYAQNIKNLRGIA